ncbi:MAG TPA: hypothetical protein VFO69_10060 [Allosphingosinicella sp.]|nr:hypothetical protein [Allosphingosinicella sp.]
MSMLRFGCAVASAAVVFMAVPASTQRVAPGLVLDRLETGLWELRSSSGAGLGSICLGDRLRLAQPQHRDTDCAREVIASDSRSATVHYGCPGIGRGRTTIRLETPRLVQIDSQGIDRGAPFALRAEARRTGAC